MSYSYTEKKRIRKNFGTFTKVMDLPNLIETQTKSYSEFLQADVAPDARKKQGLEDVFQSLFPIKSVSGNAALEYVSYELGKNTYDVQECLVQGLSYSAPLRIKVKLVLYDRETNFKEVKDIKEYKPYDLIRIEGHVPVTDEYYTMSPAGIVQNCPGENSECIPLSAWMRHGMLFKILRNIGFYKYFLHRKIFITWKENVRFILFVKQRKAVGSRLYMTRKTTISAILSIKKHLMGVQSVRLLYLDGRTLDKDSFVEQQTQKLYKIWFSI